MEEKIKEAEFPFEPNKKVKAAFRQEAQVKRAVAVMTEAIARVAADVLDPWAVLREEHPELLEETQRLRYNALSETVDVEEWRRRK